MILGLNQVNQGHFKTPELIVGGEGTGAAQTKLHSEFGEDGYQHSVSDRDGEANLEVVVAQAHGREPGSVIVKNPGSDGQDVEVALYLEAPPIEPQPGGASEKLSFSGCDSVKVFGDAGSFQVILSYGPGREETWMLGR